MNDLASLARRPDADIDLIHAALLIAREQYPNLDIARYRSKVEALAAQARAGVGTARGSARRAVDRLNAFFFGRQGFHGNNEDYYDPRNSYLNDVLDRRTGIPITLSVLYADIGRRLELPTSGIGFPGRFLVRCGDLIVDCFDGKVIDRDGCQALLDSMYGRRVRLTEEMLRNSTLRETLARMLANLRGVFIQRGDLGRALRFAELGVAVQPDRAEPLRDRGMVLLHVEDFGRAVMDLEEYLRRQPGGPDAGVVRENLKLARKLLARVN